MVLEKWFSYKRIIAFECLIHQIYLLLTGFTIAVLMSNCVTELKTIPQILSTQVFGPSELAEVKLCWSWRKEFVAHGIFIQSLAQEDATSVPAVPTSFITLPEMLNDIDEGSSVIKYHNTLASLRWYHLY